MPVFRVEKNKDFTTMSNIHLRDKNLSLKAKGLLSIFLSLPDEWHYSVKGITSICKEGKDAIESGLEELKLMGYLKVKKLLPSETESGRYEYEYIIYETPRNQDPEKQGLEIQGVEKQALDNQGIEIQGIENPSLLNTYISNTKELNTDKSITEKEKEVRHRYGQYDNVLLSDTEMEKLKQEFPYDYQEWIERVSEYVASTGKSYKNFLATIRNWARKEGKISGHKKLKADEPDFFAQFRI